MVQEGEGRPRPRPARRRTSWWRWAIGIGLLALLLGVAGPQALYETLLDVSPGWATVTVLVAGLWLFLGALNVWVLLRSLTPIKLALVVPIYVSSWAVSNVVPGQLGDAAQIAFLRRHGVAIATSGAAYLVDKFISICWMLAVAAFGIGVYMSSLQGLWLLTLPAAGLMLGFAGIAIASRVRARPGSFVSRVQTLVGSLVDQLRVFLRYPGRLALNAALTVVKWAVVGLKYFCAFQAFGAALPYKATATIPVVSSLVGYIPVTVGGVGTTEWTAVALFERAGAGAPAVLSVYLFLRAMLLVVAFAIIAAMRPRDAVDASVPSSKSAS